MFESLSGARLDTGEEEKENRLCDVAGRDTAQRAFYPGWVPGGHSPQSLPLADAELSAQLSRRLDINEGAARPRRCRVFNPYTEFPEFSRRLIKDLESMFKLYDAGRDGYLRVQRKQLWEGTREESFPSCFQFMEPVRKLSSPLWIPEVCWFDLSHPCVPIPLTSNLFLGGLDSFKRPVFFQISVQALIIRSKLSLCRPLFLLIFHKAAAGELQEDSGLMALAKLSEINVALEGVKGAKNFFEAKVQALSLASKFEAELKAEQDERKREEEERRLRQAAFQELKANFST
ncbi:PREDICTED: EF-hand domain-containing protein D1 [Mandrillus leucophaeus]|uniref:EF-hand domain-containing protein D1 n=1 Tax=Mandrillus leucophaeus TaxID=9568 RepID=UPI0005F4B952|nr:PREDICTED: EF-hand domain-containing protein D1 [Mandrillus leucophaeus]